MQKNDYLWKGILEDLLDDFLRLMHPNADEIFDFDRGITFLDKELEQLFPPEDNNDFSPKIVDKLAKLYTRKGSEKWVLIHCEVQGEYQKWFPLRMYKYYARIFDKYDKQISAYAILTEESKKTRTNQYTSEFLGTKLDYHYNIYKISQQNEEELRKSDNPFAMVALTARSVLKNKPLNDDALMEIKEKLLKQLLEKSFSKAKIRKIMIFLKFYINFGNSQNNIIFDEKIKQITGRTETMGIEEMVLVDREKRGIELGEKRGIELGEKRGIELGEKRGEKRGIENKAREIIINMIQKKFDDETIADLANVQIEYVRKTRKSIEN